MEVTLKLCSNCAYFEPWAHTQDDGACNCPKVTWVHPVSGEVRKPSAFVQRMAIAKDACGISGQHFTYAPGSPPEPSEQEDMG